MDLPTPIVFLSRRSHVSLHAIDSLNWRAVAQLMVDKDQAALVLSSTLEAMCEHQFNAPQSVIKAIYADETPIGFLNLHLYQTPSSNGSIDTTKDSTDDNTAANSPAQLRLFMIDRRNQGLGFGSKAIQLLQEEIITHQPPFERTTGLFFTTSTFALVDSQDSPALFFESVGFQHRNDCKEMVWVPGTLP